MNKEGDEEGSSDIRHNTPQQEIIKVKDLALTFHALHHLRRQEVAPAGIHQLLVQDPAPTRRCGTEGRTGHQGLEGGNGDGNRDGKGMSTRAGMGGVRGSVNDNGEEERGER